MHFVTALTFVTGKDQGSHSLRLTFPSHSEDQEMWLETKNKHVLDAISEYGEEKDISAFSERHQM